MTLQHVDYVFRVIAFLFAISFHESAHAWMANRCGDPTARMLGRITLNPISHIDPWGSILLPLLFWIGSQGRFTFGGAKPVPVVTRNFRNYVRGDIIVSSAGIVTNLFLALLFTALFALLGVLAAAAPDMAELAGTAQRMVTWGIWFNLTLAFFNLIPVPPLDGSRLFYHLLPPKLGLQYRSLDRFGFLPIMALLFFARPLISLLMTPAAFGMKTLLGLVMPYAIGDAWNIFDG